MVHRLDHSQQLLPGDTVVPLWRAEGLAIVGHHALFTLHHLRQCYAGSLVAGIRIQNVQSRGIRVSEYWCFY